MHAVLWRPWWPLHQVSWNRVSSGGIYSPQIRYNGDTNLLDCLKQKNRSAGHVLYFNVIEYESLGGRRGTGRLQVLPANTFKTIKSSSSSGSSSTTHPPSSEISLNCCISRSLSPLSPSFLMANGSYHRLKVWPVNTTDSAGGLKWLVWPRVVWPSFSLLRLISSCWVAFQAIQRNWFILL